MKQLDALVVILLAKIKWNHWVGSRGEGDPSMLIRNILHICGRRLDLHMMLREDEVGCFHTHPAHAWRVVLWGGYVEEYGCGCQESRRPGFMGLMRPHTKHRIHDLFKDKSVSLWFRGKKRAPITTEGC